MRPLQAIALTEITHQPGRPPRMEWLALALLVIDDSYQRRIENRGSANIKRIAAEFEWCKFSPVMVAPTGGNRYAVIDGQHRSTAALSLGYDKVPCYIVDARPEKAAAIFAAVNGNVTSLSILQVFRAARAAGEEWAVQIDRICAAAGVTPLTYPKASNLQEPLETMALGALRECIKRHGEIVLALGLKCLVASINSRKLGFLNSKRIKSMCFALSLHPGWAGDEEATLRSMAVHDLWLSDMVNVEAALVRKLGQRRAAGDAWSTIVERVRGYHERRFKASMIAGITHLPHAEIQRALDEILAEQS